MNEYDLFDEVFGDSRCALYVKRFAADFKTCNADTLAAASESLSPLSRKGTLLVRRERRLGKGVRDGMLVREITCSMSWSQPFPSCHRKSALALRQSCVAATDDTLPYPTAPETLPYYSCVSVAAKPGRVPVRDIVKRGLS